MVMSWRRSVAAGAAFGLFSLAILRGQIAVKTRARNTPAEESKPRATLRSDTNLVLVPVSVCDPANHPVTGLEKEHFKIFDDRVEQTVTHFAMDDESVAVGLLLDVSGSMGSKLRRSRQAAAA